ncbi:pyrimidine/purine nucleoside phosphorylase [Puniceicoccaceae bacterium K14]|nr:pyrimidine/purine nucleoside phosphorylase [Puniceicoccaceae bacterium K14]
MEFSNVTAFAKANLYFGGKVVSHAIQMEDGSKKTFGIIFPGEYHFDTEAAERMEITDGSCTVKIDGQESSVKYSSGQHFDIEANSGFSIEIAEGTTQYICSYR